MRACSRCGTPNDDSAKVCVTCGVAFEGQKPGLKQTMLGMVPNPAAPVPPVPAQVPPPATAPAASKFGGTMLGIQSPFAPPPSPATGRVPTGGPVAAEPPPPQTGKKPGLQQTMLGFGPGPGLSPHAPVPNEPGSHAEHYRTQPGFAAPASFEKPAPELLGSTTPAAVGPGQTAVVPAFQPASPVAAQPAPPASLGEKRTMLGVAIPGIAPLHPGQPVRPSPALEEPPPTPRGPSSYPPPETSSLPPPPSEYVPKRPLPPKSAVALIGLAAMLVVGGIVGVILWESPRPISAEVEVDDHGEEGLALKCDDCADGATASLDGATATFSGHRALLGLTKPLKLGKNDLKLATKRSSTGKTEEVSVSVALDYRVKGDLSGLSQDPPSAKVVAEAAAGSAVVVDGHALTLDAGGKAEYAIDVSREAEGPSDTVVSFERRVPYTVTATGGTSHQGQVTLKFGIVPLRVDAPGAAIVIDGENFMLAGRTLKDGRILVSGRPITVDGSGRFAQLMNVSKEGETTIPVRADAKDYGPRIVHVHVKRVARLSDEGATYRQSAATEYSSIVDADAKKGLSVALEGEVVEARLDGEVTVLLLDVKRGCAASPCLSRVVYGGRFDVKRSATVTAFGQVTRAVDGPRTGAKIPEVAALFLVRGHLK